MCFLLLHLHRSAPAHPLHPTAFSSAHFLHVQELVAAHPLALLLLVLQHRVHACDLLELVIHHEHGVDDEGPNLLEECVEGVQHLHFDVLVDDDDHHEDQDEVPDVGSHAQDRVERVVVPAREHHADGEDQGGVYLGVKDVDFIGSEIEGIFN